MAQTLCVDVMCMVARMSGPDTLVRMAACNKVLAGELADDVRDVAHRRSSLIKHVMRACFYEGGGKGTRNLPIVDDTEQMEKLAGDYLSPIQFWGRG